MDFSAVEIMKEIINLVEPSDSMKTLLDMLLGMIDSDPGEIETTLLCKLGNWIFDRFSDDFDEEELEMKIQRVFLWILENEEFCGVCDVGKMLLGLVKTIESHGDEEEILTKCLNSLIFLHDRCGNVSNYGDSTVIECWGQVLITLSSLFCDYLKTADFRLKVIDLIRRVGEFPELTSNALSATMTIAVVSDAKDEPFCSKLVSTMKRFVSMLLTSMCEESSMALLSNCLDFVMSNNNFQNVLLDCLYEWKTIPNVRLLFEEVLTINGRFEAIVAAWKIGNGQYTQFVENMFGAATTMVRASDSCDGSSCGCDRCVIKSIVATFNDGKDHCPAVVR